MFQSFFASLFTFSQVFAASLGSYTVDIPAHTEMTVQWREITFVIPADAFTEDVTLTLRDRGEFGIATTRKLPKGFTSTQNVYGVVFSEEPQAAVPFTLALRQEDDAYRRRLFYTTIDESQRWSRIRSRVYAEDGLIRGEWTAQSGRVVVGMHPEKVEIPVKTQEFSAYGQLPYSDTGIVIDERSKRVLYADDADKQRSIASLTKILTVATCAERNPDTAREITYTSAYNPGGASMDVVSGDVLTLEQALYGAMVPSANNMAMTVAHECRSSYGDFIADMNRYAQAARAQHTQIEEATGLDPDNISTARDLARIARRAFRRNSELFESAADISRYSFTTANTSRTVSEASTNLFDGRGIYEVVAFKTGYLPPYADRTLVLKVRKIGTTQTVLVVLLGNPEYRTIFDEAYELIDWTFNNWIFQNYVS